MSQGGRKANGKAQPRAHKTTLKALQSDRRSKANAAFGARSAYLSDRLHKGSEVWVRLIEPRQQEWAESLGADSFEALPIGQRELVRQWVADYLLVSLYVPEEQVSTSVKEVRSAMNSLARITRELHGMAKPRDVTDLRSYVAENYPEKAG